MTVLGVRPIIAQLRKEFHCRGESRLYILWQDGFIRMMAEASGAAKEEHGGRDRGGENHRVVAGSAGHPAGWKASLRGGFNQQSGQVRIERDGGLLKLFAGSDVCPASGCGCLRKLQDRHNGRFANTVVGVTYIEGSGYFSGNDVSSAWGSLYFADSCDETVL
jgi:hypothetical protein